MVKKSKADKTLLALKYPDYSSWRDLDAAMRKGGFWEDGTVVRLSDPEMQPQMDKMMERIKSDKKYARKLLTRLSATAYKRSK
jgi:hypothetical protein